MRTLGYRFPDSCPNGTAQALYGNSGLIACPSGQRCTSRAIRPRNAGTPSTSQARGFATQLKRPQEQPSNCMTHRLPALIPIQEKYPQEGIEVPVAFPREPEPITNKCPILRHNQDDLTLEAKAPATVAITTEIVTEIVTEIATETAMTAGAGTGIVAAMGNSRAAAPVAVALIASQSRFN